MKFKELAKIVGIHPQYFSDIIRKKKNVSKKLATKLENITGIEKLIWLYPEDYDLKQLLKYQMIINKI